MGVHNIHFLMTLLNEMRDAIGDGTFPDWVRKFLQGLFPTATPAPCKFCPPRWVKQALDSVNISIADLFDWSDTSVELADMPRHVEKKKSRGIVCFLGDVLEANGF